MKTLEGFLIARGDLADVGGQRGVDRCFVEPTVNPSDGLRVLAASRYYLVLGLASKVQVERLARWIVGALFGTDAGVVAVFVSEILILILIHNVRTCQGSRMSSMS